MKSLLLSFVATFCLLLSTPTQAQVTFQFDYTYDTGFFTGGNEARQTYLAAAGSYVADLISGTPLATITPGGINSWTTEIFDPRDIEGILQFSNLSVSANNITVYVGAYDLGGSLLGVGGPAGYGASGTQAWIDTLASRGNDTSYAMTGVGAITFNSTANWYFDSDASSIEDFPGQSDFFSVAAHELFHLLGFGTNLTWVSLHSGGSFTGAASVNAYGGIVPLNAGEDHWLEGTESTIYATATVQETLLDPSLTEGTRKYATELDVAALADLGYTITPAAVPEPATYAALLAAAVLLFACWCRRKRQGFDPGT